MTGEWDFLEDFKEEKSNDLVIENVYPVNGHKVEGGEDQKLTGDKEENNVIAAI